MKISDSGSVKPIDRAVAAAPAWLGWLGVSGVTGYVGMADFLAPRRGETIVVSAARRIARSAGARTGNLAGAPEKCANVVDALGAGGSIQHRRSGFADALSGTCPNRINADFERVGGAARDAACARKNDFGRPAVAGLIPQNNVESGGGPDWCPPPHQAADRSRLHAAPSSAAARRTRSGHGGGASGQVASRNDVGDGLENAPDAHLVTLEGHSFGNASLKLD